MAGLRGLSVGCQWHRNGGELGRLGPELTGKDSALSERPLRLRRFERRPRYCLATACYCQLLPATTCYCHATAC